MIIHSHGGPLDSSILGKRGSIQHWGDRGEPQLCSGASSCLYTGSSSVPPKENCRMTVKLTPLIENKMSSSHE